MSNKHTYSSQYAALKISDISIIQKSYEKQYLALKIIEPPSALPNIKIVYSKKMPYILSKM